MSVPPHPSDHDQTIPTSISKRNRLLVALVAVAVLAVIALHLTGVVAPG